MAVKNSGGSIALMSPSQLQNQLRILPRSIRRVLSVAFLQGLEEPSPLDQMTRAMNGGTVARPAVRNTAEPSRADQST